ncbi:MAG: heme-binding protein [Thermodesulfobacteriota bacterium]
MIVAGGLPVFFNDQIVGGIGCSSGHADQDEVVARAGVDALLGYLKK